MTTQEEFIEQVANLVQQRINAAGACGTVIGSDSSGCSNVLWSPVSTQKFYRGCRTNIDEIESGVLPLAPGQTVVLRQGAHPGWLGGCFMFTYQLANNATNHGDIQFKWFIDDQELDTVMYGSEIYDNNNSVIGNGKHPLPLHCGGQCCIGGLNRLRLMITHTGANNQLQTPRIFVEHGKKACCNSCASGCECQTGCTGCALPQTRLAGTVLDMKALKLG